MFEKRDKRILGVWETYEVMGSLEDAKESLGVILEIESILNGTRVQAPKEIFSQIPTPSSSQLD